MRAKELIYVVITMSISALGIAYFLQFIQDRIYLTLFGGLGVAIVTGVVLSIISSKFSSNNQNFLEHRKDAEEKGQ